MHELALVTELMATVEAEAARSGLTRVLVVALEVGALAAVDVGALTLAFEVARVGGVADRARLDVAVRPGVAMCLACGRTVEVETRLDPCPACGGLRLRVDGGTAVRLTAIEGAAPG